MGIYGRRRGRFQRTIEEQIVILRAQDQAPDQGLPDDNYIFENKSFPRDRYIVIISNG